MLKFIESFDHLQCTSLDDIDLYQALGYTDINGGGMGMLWMGWGYSRFRVNPGTGQRGTPALEIAAGGGFVLPYIQRDCERLVFGIAIGPPLDFVGNDAYVGWNSRSPYGPGFAASFRYDADTNFRIECRFNTRSSMIVTMCTGANGAGYPDIVTSEYIPVPNAFDDYTFVELSVDVTDYTNGTAKVAVNGLTYIEKTGIFTAAYNLFGDDPNDPRSKLNNVAVSVSGMSVPGVAYEAGSYYIDSMYICDDAGGYQDDFLGPVFAKSLFPVADGAKHNWTPYENSIVLEDGENSACVDDNPLVAGNEVTYVEADQDMADDLLIYDAADYPDECTLIAVNHRTAFRNVASQGNPPPNTMVPIYQIVGNPVIVTNSLAKKVTGWAYSFLDIYYDLVPAFAIPWTRLLLEQSEFGYMLREAIWTAVQIDDVGFADEVIDE